MSLLNSLLPPLYRRGEVEELSCKTGSDVIVMMMMRRSSGNSCKPDAMNTTAAAAASNDDTHLAILGRKYDVIGVGIAVSFRYTS